MSSSQASSFPPLFRIPLETRLQIYEELLYQETLEISSERVGKRIKEICPLRSVSILLVNRQVHEEAEGILYKMKTFMFRSNVCYEIRLFLLTVSEVAYNSIQSVGFDWTSFLEGKKWDILDLLLGCKSLRSLTLVNFTICSIWSFNILCCFRLKHLNFDYSISEQGVDVAQRNTLTLNVIKAPSTRTKLQIERTDEDKRKKVTHHSIY